MSKVKEITFASGFSGIGGFDLGLIRNGFKRVWSNDIDKYANQVYTSHFGEEGHYSGDIRGVDPKEIPQHDIFCGGFPCQSFSVAGKRKGFTDTRGTLFFEICRIATYHRPELLFLENVKGLLSAPLVDEAGDTIPGTHGRVFETILKSLEELGYWWEYQVLNSKNYGVPQNRERVFIVGHLRTGCTGPIFPFTEVSDNLVETQGKTQEEGPRVRIANTLSGSGGGNKGQFIAHTISARYGKDGSENLIALRHIRTDRGKEERQKSQKQGQDNTPYGDGFREYAPSKEPVTGTVTTGINKDALIGVLGMEEPYIKNLPHGYNDGFVKPLPSLKANSGAQYNELLVNKARIRRLTPIECERLQGFPDGWTEGISDTQRYKCLGNAVTVNVIEYLGRLLKASINSKSLRTDCKPT